jgi:hypothetical protein
VTSLLGLPVVQSAQADLVRRRSAAALLVFLPRTAWASPGPPLKSLRKSADALAILSFAESFKCFCGHVAQCTTERENLAHASSLGKLGNYHGVILPHRQIPTLNLASCFLGGFPSGIESCRAFFDQLAALSGRAMPHFPSHDRVRFTNCVSAPPLHSHPRR